MRTKDDDSLSNRERNESSLTDKERLPQICRVVVIINDCEWN